MQLNYLLDAGAFVVNADGTFSVNQQKIKETVTELTAKLLTLQGKGDKEAVAKMFDELAVLRPEVKKHLDALEGKVPIDISPNYVTAKELLASQ